MRVPRFDRVAWVVLFAALVAFTGPTTASANHVNITIDGNLADLIAAVGSDPDAGCSLTSPLGNIYTQQCTFVNGYDIINGYVFVDFEEPSGDVSSDFDLYAGFQVQGTIGDYDGDGNPDVFSNTQGGCAIPANETGTNRSGRTGISSNESYTVEIRDCVSGALFRVGVKDNQVIDFDNLQVVAGATYAKNGSFLEVSIPNIKQVFPGLDLCDLSISLTSNAEFDGLGEDRTNACAIEVPLSIDVEKTPETQAVCEGDPATFTITVTNDGACVLNDVRVTDVLGAGLTFQSSNPPSTGDSQNREWIYDNVNLAPGQSLTITLVATATGPCTPSPFRNDVTAEGVHTVNEAACPGRADRTTSDTDFAEVTCLPEPCVDQVTCSAPPNACDGDLITISASARNCSTAPEDITIQILGPGGAVLKTETFQDVPAGQSRTSSIQITFDCTAGQTTTYSGRATAANDCGETPPSTSSGCPVLCNPEPCVSVTCDAPATASDGEVLDISGTATNCSTGPEDIEICVYGPGNVLLGCETFTNVPAGESRTHHESFTAECEPGQTLQFHATAQAENDCSETNLVTSQDPCETECQGGGSCPRTVGFWTQQCAQRDGGSTKFDRPHMDDITECVDNRLDVFSWGSDFDGFCEIITPTKPMNCKKQALRQFAAFVANFCAGDLGFKASNGDSIFIDPNSPNPCESLFPDADNLGELIDEIDDKLVDLANEGADAQDSRYCDIIECVDGINNARTIPVAPGCSEGTGDPGLRGGGSDVESQASGEPVASALELYRPAPNPFSSTTSIAYAVGGQTGESVQIGIYDVAGRLVRNLVNGYQAPGRYQTTWDGRSDDGSTVTKGVYFLRAYVGGVRMVNAARILYVR